MQFVKAVLGPRRSLLASFFLLLACCLPLTSQARVDLSTQAHAVAAHNFDGDTIKLTDRRVVRLAGIDSPEMGGKKKLPQYYARESRALLARLCKGKKVELRPAGEESKDRYGRIIAEVLLRNGDSLNEIMLAQGAAFFYPDEGQDPGLQQRLHAVQQKAIAERRGMWAHLLAHPVAHQTFMGNRNSMRFFPSNCIEAQQIKPRNRVYFGTLMDAFLAGYAPERACPFWPEQR